LIAILYLLLHTKCFAKACGYTQKAEHIRLVKGTVRVNPHLRVLCPTLAKGGKCRKGKQHKKGDYLRPKLLLKNHGDPSLQLWICEGCSNFLLRVNINEVSLI